MARPKFVRYNGLTRTVTNPQTGEVMECEEIHVGGTPDRWGAVIWRGLSIPIRLTDKQKERVRSHQAI